MAPVRVLFVGNAEACVPWVGLAKKLSRQCYHAGVINKTYKVADGVQIRVENVLPAVTAFGNKMGQDFGAICKVWIEAGGYLSGYQFYTTSPEVHYVGNSGEYHPGGSSVFVPTPSYPVTGQPQPQVKAYPIHSLVEDPPEFNGKPAWGYTLMPSSLFELNELMQRGMFHYKEAWQYNGLPEATVTSDGVTVFNAWTQPESQIFGFGGLSGWYPSQTYDILWDAAPKKVGKVSKNARPKSMQVPDSDWPNRSCLQNVPYTKTDGSSAIRSFYILHAANNEWLCWPVLEEGLLDVVMRVTGQGIYGSSYKGNVLPQYVKRVPMPYPSWAFNTPTGFYFRDDLIPDDPLFHPRYTASFKSNGRQAVLTMVQRTPLQNPNYSILDFQDPDNWAERVVSTTLGPFVRYADVAKHRSVRSSSLASVLTDRFMPYPFAVMFPQEREGVTAKVYPHFKWSFLDRSPVATDRLGYAVFNLTVAVTGDNLEDFTFSVTRLHDESPDDFYARNLGELSQVVYAKNVFNAAVPAAWPKLTAPIAEDSFLFATMTLYQHTNEKKYLQGCYVENAISRQMACVKASFYNSVEHTLSVPTLLFELPLKQTHGSGYQGDPVRDEEGNIIAMPAPAHEFVENPTSCAEDRFRFRFTEDPPKYTYSAVISDLDLSVLSFYYTVTCYKSTMEQTPHSTEVHGSGASLYQFEYDREISAKKTMVRAYVFGAEAPFGEYPSDSFCGNDTIDNGWITGWVKNACGVWPEADIEPLDIAYTNDFVEGSGALNENPYVWWLNGACFECIYAALNHCWNDITLHQGTFNPTLGGYNYSSTAGFSGPALGSITEANVGGLIDYAYQMGDFLALEYGFTNPFDRCTRNAEPFDLVQFKDRSGYAIVRICERLARLSEADQGDTDIDLVSYALLAVAPVTTNLMNSRYDLLEDDNIDNFKDLVRLIDFPFGEFFYAKERIDRFACSPYCKGRGKIQTTKEGHYSFYYPDHFSLVDSYSVVMYLYTDIKGEKFPFAASGYDPYRTDVGDTFGLTTASFDWKPIDGIGWHYGAVTCDHLTLYNIAYDPETGTSGQKKMRVWRNKDAPLRSKYIATDFKPYFSISYIANTPAYEPASHWPCLQSSLQYEVDPSDGVQRYDSGVDQVDYSHYSHYKHLRLSPLFF